MAILTLITISLVLTAMSVLVVDILKVLNNFDSPSINKISPLTSLGSKIQSTIRAIKSRNELIRGESDLLLRELTIRRSKVLGQYQSETITRNKLAEGIAVEAKQIFAAHEVFVGILSDPNMDWSWVNAAKGASNEHELTKMTREYIARQSFMPSDLKEPWYVSSQILPERFAAFDIGSCLTFCSHAGREKAQVRVAIVVLLRDEIKLSSVYEERLAQFGREASEKILSAVSIEKLGLAAASAISASRLKGDLLAHFSHDFRSPLNNIKAILNILRLEGTPVDMPQLIDSAQSNCAHIAEMIEDILDYSKYQAGKLRCVPELTNISELIEQIITDNLPLAKSKQLKLFATLPVEPIYIYIDRKQLRRVLVNLVVNAIKFTEQGKVELKLVSNSEQIVIEVIDTGPGIEVSSHEKIFHPFETSSHRHSDSVGLGLAISKMLVEANKGELQLQSKIGFGSSFTISLAKSCGGLEDPCNKNILKLDNRRPNHGSEKISILVADDDLDTAQSTARILRSKGFTACCATSLSETLAAIQRDDPSILLIDFNFSNANCIALVKAAMYMGRDMRCFVLTGSSDALVRGELYCLGVEEVFTKPFDADLFCKALARSVASELRLVANARFGY